MKCFVIMPFGDARSDPEYARRQEVIYSRWIKPTVESIRMVELGDEQIVCHRADKEVRPGEVISHLVENLVGADIVIADLSGQNPNVFYELGVRHALRANTIIIAQDMTHVPFDLRGQRLIVYRYDPDEMLNLKESLERAIREIVRAPNVIDNPVGRFLHDRQVERRLGEAAPGYDLVKNMFAELSSLREEFKTYVDEVRQITKTVTSPEAAGVLSQQGESLPLEALEGVWTSNSDSTYCMRVINGTLAVPYCWSDDTHLTGHYYNWKVIGRTLFARFEWFVKPISGYAFFKVVSENELAGGWWYSEDVPFEVASDISRINDSIPGMSKSLWRRDVTGKACPAWAEEYFDQVKTGAISAEFRYKARKRARFFRG